MMLKKMQTMRVFIVALIALVQGRPQAPPKFMLWNYFPYLQQPQQQVSVMPQQGMMPVMQPVPVPQYPAFELIFNGPIPIAANNMPILGEIQFHTPVQPSAIPGNLKISPTTSTSTRRRPQPTTTTTSPSVPGKRLAYVKQSTPPIDDAVKSQISKGIFEMARTIQTEILSKDSDCHQTGSKFNVFSPINIATVLSLLELGTRGQTNQELQHILGFDKLTTLSTTTPLDHHYALGQMLESILQPDSALATTAPAPVQINMANGVFLQTGCTIRPDYRTTVETIYQSQVTALDFQQRPVLATKFINDWVQQETNRKIDNIVADVIDSSTRLMVASAMYFKALWVSSFKMSATSKRPFYPNGRQGRQILVDTMANGGVFKYYQSKDYDCGILALQFKGDTTTMYIILPNKSNVRKLKKLQATLTSDIIEDMISKMQMRSILITMPKMHLVDTLELKDVLAQLGVHSFSSNSYIDLSGITDQSAMTLDGFIHKIDLTINEAGTEAAAVTASYLSRQEAEVEFRVDSPFMFLLQHDESRLPLFYGAVFEPVNV